MVIVLTDISIVGSGWVGKNAGEGLMGLGHDVIFQDISKGKVEKLEEEGLDATTDLEDAVLKSDVTFLCVPTPTAEGSINLDYMEEAVEDLAKILKDKDGYHLVVVKSTVVPTTTENLVIPLLEKVSGKEVGEDFGVCMNPEFMTEISNSWTDEEDFTKGFSSDRVVIGEYDEESGQMLENEVYGGLDVPVMRTGLSEAEMIKYANNCMLATKISFWNQIFLISNELDINSDEVAEIVGMDPRIGKYGTVHGMAFGGKCLPKDLRALIDFAEEETGEKPKLLKAVEDINEYMAEEYGVRE